jgi:hypothetical protein
MFFVVSKSPTHWQLLRHPHAAPFDVHVTTFLQISKYLAHHFSACPYSQREGSMCRIGFDFPVALRIGLTCEFL